MNNLACNVFLSVHRLIVLAPKCLKLCNLIKHTPYFNTICLKQEVFVRRL